MARFYLFMVASLAACALLPMLFGLSGAIVQSGSMQPHIDAGDVVLSRAFSPGTPPPIGRVITFRAPSGSTRTGDVLHRLVAVNSNGSLMTKGDANREPDSAPLALRDIISQASILIPYVGLPSYWLTTGAFLALGLWTLLTMGALIVEAADRGGSRHPPADPGNPSGPGGDTEDPTEPATHQPPSTTRPRGDSRTSLLNRIGNALGLRSAPTVALTAIAALAMAPLGLTGAAFSAITSSVGNNWVAAGPATTLAFSTNPSGSTGGIAFVTQPVVAVKDARGDTIGVSSAPVTLRITNPSGATLSCTANPKNAVKGVAAFAGCSIGKAGTYTLTATSGTLTAAVSASFTIATGPAGQLAFTTNPTGSNGGEAFATQPVVAVQDAGGNTVTGSSIFVALSITPPAGGATLTCAANPTTVVAGVATFAGCRIGDPGTYALTAAAAGLTNAISAGFTITVGVATQLVFTTSPSGSTGGIALARQPVVAVRDSSGNTVTSSGASVDLSITNPAGATLSCTQDPQTAASGVASFTGCKVDKIGTYTLTAVSSGLTKAVSSSFTITVGPAAKLGFTTSPSPTARDTAFGAQPVVTVQDAGGNTQSSSGASVTLAITPPTGGAALTNCSANPRTASSGVATFSNCRIDTAGTYTLTATASGLATALSTSVTIFGQATNLQVTTNPSNTTSGMAFATQPVVTVKDAGGRTVSNSNVGVTLSITNPAGATLTCTAKTKNAVAGVATFAGCSIDRVGTYTLTATASGLATAVSANFIISVGPATRLVFTTQPSNATVSTSFSTQPVVAIQDPSGNTASSNAPVTLSITTPAGANLTCTANPVTALLGVATFAGCKIDKAGTYTLTATSGTLTTAVSASFTMSPATLLTCSDQQWMAVFSWSPTPYQPTTYTLYVNGIQVQATGADGWNSVVQLTSNNVPAWAFPQGSATVQVRKVVSGQEQVIGNGVVLLGPADHRTYTCPLAPEQLGTAGTYSALGATSVVNSLGPTILSGDLGVSP